MPTQKYKEKVNEMKDIKTLEKVLKLMQNDDSNGTWDEALDDIKKGRDTVENVIETVLETLADWVYDDRKYQAWIDLLK